MPLEADVTDHRSPEVHEPVNQLEPGQTVGPEANQQLDSQTVETAGGGAVSDTVRQIPVSDESSNLSVSREGNEPSATQPVVPSEIDDDPRLANLVTDKSKAEAMAHAGNLNRTLAATSRQHAEAWTAEGQDSFAKRDTRLADWNDQKADGREENAGIEHDIQNGLPAAEKNRGEYEQKLLQKIDEHSKGLREALDSLLEFRKNYAGGGQLGEYTTAAEQSHEDEQRPGTQAWSPSN